jgi:hypothetical protein
MIKIIDNYKPYNKPIVKELGLYDIPLLEGNPKGYITILGFNNKEVGSGDSGFVTSYGNQRYIALEAVTNNYDINPTDK